MSKCNVCGKDLSNCDRISCVDPVITAAWRATDWIELIEAIGHYYQLMEAFDPGGSHRTDSVKHAEMLEAVENQVKQAVRDRAAK